MRKRWTTIQWPQWRLIWGCWLIGGGSPIPDMWCVCVGPVRMLMRRKSKISTGRWP